MSWAARQRLRILLLIGVVIALIVALALYLSIHRAPSCNDGVQNENEAGIDCGGPCPYLCSASEQAPVVRFTQSFSGLASTTDALAYVDNPNRDAYARNVSYTLSLYDASGILVAKPVGTLDLAPGVTTPVFLANIPTGSVKVVRAYLAIDPSTLAWQAAGSPAVGPSIGSPVVSGSADAPRVSVALTNPTAVPMAQVVTIAALFDASGNLITASQTLVPQIPGQGSSEAVFTWNAPFAAAPARIDILPLPQLP